MLAADETPYSQTSECVHRTSIHKYLHADKHSLPRPLGEHGSGGFKDRIMLRHRQQEAETLTYCFGPGEDIWEICSFVLKICAKLV